VLHIDADETLYREDAPLLRATMDVGDGMENIAAVVLPILNDTQNGGVAKHYFPRLHKRGRARFVGIVHNQLEHEGDVLTAEIRLHHYGYALTELEMQAKYARTESLLRKRIAADADDLDAWHYLIRTWHNQHRHAQVVANAEKVLDNPRSTLGQRYAVTHDLIASLIYLGWYDEAEEIVHQAMSEMPQSADWAYLAATLYMTSKRPAQAIGHWERYLELAAVPPEGFTHAMLHHYDATDQARQMLARCREMQAEV
jgi:tetratricopeptide (TPR) repeat protein